MKKKVLVLGTILVVAGLSLVGCPMGDTGSNSDLMTYVEAFNQHGASTGERPIGNFGTVIGPGGAYFWSNNSRLNSADVYYYINVAGGEKQEVAMSLGKNGELTMNEAKNTGQALGLLTIGLAHDAAFSAIHMLVIGTPTLPLATIFSMPAVVALSTTGNSGEGEWEIGIPMGPSVAYAKVVIHTNKGDRVVFVYPLDPADWDRDGDALSDAWESNNSLDPDSVVGENGAQGDPDGDLVPNWEEQIHCCIPYGPNGPDTDGDGWTDREEIDAGTDPCDPNDHPGSPGSYTLTLGTVGSGTVAANPSGGTYSAGQNVVLTATPASGWTFSHWTGSLSGSTNPATVVMNSNKSVTAVFTSTVAQDKIYVDLTWASNQLTFSANTTSYPSGGFVGVATQANITYVGLELYHLTGSSPWVERQVFNFAGSWPVSGVVTKFRPNVLRFEVVANNSGCYGDPAKLVVRINGQLVPRVNDGSGNVAYQVDVSTL